MTHQEVFSLGSDVADVEGTHVTLFLQEVHDPGQLCGKGKSLTDGIGLVTCLQVVTKHVTGENQEDHNGNQRDAQHTAQLDLHPKLSDRVG